MKNDYRILLTDICKKHGIEYVGVVSPGPYTDLKIYLEQRIAEGKFTGLEEKDIIKRTDPKETMSEAGSVAVCLFPYYSKAADRAVGNISIHSRVPDYHKIIIEKLNKIGEDLKKEIPDFRYSSYTDTGPLADRYLAQRAGLGYRGLSSNLINDKYGSYVFIGYMINNYPFTPDAPNNKKCLQCGQCIRSCPGKAISENYGMDPKRCLSYITQKKGELSEQETKLMSVQGMVYGCDICQEVCPLNSGLPDTPIGEFKENLISGIDESELGKMSSGEFKKRYGDRTFAWRGLGVLKRNLEIASKDK